jgi:hypothetical protein
LVQADWIAVGDWLVLVEEDVVVGGICEDVWMLDALLGVIDDTEVIDKLAVALD